MGRKEGRGGEREKGVGEGEREGRMGGDSLLEILVERKFQQVFQQYEALV